MASAIVGRPVVKGQHPFAVVQQPTSWRNAFARGNCVDRPTKSFRHNHPISPAAYPKVQDGIALCVALVRGYLALSQYLASIGKNPYTGGSSVEEREIEERLREVEQ